MNQYIGEANGFMASFKNCLKSNCQSVDLSVPKYDNTFDECKEKCYAIYQEMNDE